MMQQTQEGKTDRPRGKKLRSGQRVRFVPDGREGVLVRRNSIYRQWLVEFADGRLTWWWESDMEVVQ